MITKQIRLNAYETIIINSGEKFIHVTEKNNDQKVKKLEENEKYYEYETDNRNKKIFPKKELDLLIELN